MDEATKIARGYCFTDPKKEYVKVSLVSLKKAGGQEVDFNRTKSSIKKSLIDCILSL
ncbi:hypothetical protein HY448_00175 [Candidatus Pacearchaeota archaeon]|nr:hypothetical protein [Candidatus Pacearchaeota archaeon]